MTVERGMADDGARAESTSLCHPSALAYDPLENAAYVVDVGNRRRLARFCCDTRVVSTFADLDVRPTSLVTRILAATILTSARLRVFPADSHVRFVEQARCRQRHLLLATATSLVVFSVAGVPSIVVSAGQTQRRSPVPLVFQEIRDIAVDSYGRVVVLDSMNRFIHLAFTTPSRDSRVHVGEIPATIVHLSAITPYAGYRLLATSRFRDSHQMYALDHGRARIACFPCLDERDLQGSSIVVDVQQNLSFSCPRDMCCVTLPLAPPTLPLLFIGVGTAVSSSSNNCRDTDIGHFRPSQFLAQDVLRCRYFAADPDRSR